MCKPIEWVLRLANTVKVILDHKNGVQVICVTVFMAGGVFLCGFALMMYEDFKGFLTEQTRNQSIQTEVLRTIDQRLGNLERRGL